MEMASSEVEMSSCQTLNCVLSPHERCTRGDHNNNKNNNNVRNIHVAFEKNLNVFVRDPLDNRSTSGDGVVNSSKAVPECSSDKSSVSDQRLSKTEESQVLSSSSSIGSDPDPNSSKSGQPGNQSRNETRAASSLVQIWEARTTQQPPSSNQNQSQIDSRTSSSGSNTLLENSVSLNEESVKESDLIHQPIEEGNNEEKEEEEEEKEDVECESQFVPPLLPLNSGGKDRESVRVVDIIRKLSNDSETTTSNDNGSNINENGKEVQTTEVRCFPQVTCTPRIRGRQALTDLLEQMIRDRKEELACILRSHSVSKFTHRGRIQSVLRIRCYERCIAIQDSHRCKASSSTVSNLNRSPRGSGMMHLLREKNKTNSENIETGALSSAASFPGRILDKDPHKVTDKTIEKSDLKGIHQEVNSAVENAKKAVLSEMAENKNGLMKFVGVTIQKETLEGRGEKKETKEKATAKETLGGKDEKRETKKKSVAKETLQGKEDRQETKEKAVSKESLEGRGETKEKAMAKESLEGRGEKRETKEKAVAKETLEGRGENQETKEKAVAKESLEGRGKKRETKKKAIENQSVDWDNVMGMAEKLNLWTSEEKVDRRKETEKYKIESKAKTERVKKNDVLQESSRRIGSVESAETSITTSKETMTQCHPEEKVVRGKKQEDCVFVETKSKEIENTDINPRKVTAQEEQKVLQETTSKSDLNKPIEKESREEKRETEESVQGNTMMGIAEKVNLWNAEEKKNRRRVLEKSKGKANTETNKVLQEASRRISSVETAERSITTSKEMVEPKSKEIVEDKNNNPQESASHGSKEKNCSQHGEEMSILRSSEVKSTKEIDRNISQEVTKEEDSKSDGSREKTKEKKSSQQDEEMSILRDPNDENIIKESEDEETTKVEDEAMEFLKDWDENEFEEEEEEEDDWDYDIYIRDSTYDDWINEIARPRSYWEDLRRERYIEVLNTKSEKKDDICDLLKSGTVSSFLTSDLREKIDNLMIYRVQRHITVHTNQEEQEEEDCEEGGDEIDEEECSERNQEDNETEEELEKTNLDAESNDGCSQSSPRSCKMMMSWSFRDQDIVNDHESTMPLSLPEPSVPTNQSTQEMQISDLTRQMEQLQREVLELRNTVKSCIDVQLRFQKSVTQDLYRSGGSSAEERVETRSDPLKRKCCVCSVMPVDSLLYRCGHMCTCLKCAHELQWSSKKCPICMAPIVDVVRAFLDS